MLLASLLLPLLSGPVDGAGWNLYAPKEIDVRFQLPGKPTYEKLTDPSAAYMGRFRSVVGKFTYTVVVGDVTANAAAVYQKLWAKDRYGADVQKLLGIALDGARDETSGKVVANRFGQREGFPVQVAAIERPDGGGSVDAFLFTKRGIVFAGVSGPKSKALSDEGMKLLAGLDLSKRK